MAPDTPTTAPGTAPVEAPSTPALPIATQLEQLLASVTPDASAETWKKVNETLKTAREQVSQQTGEQLQELTKHVNNLMLKVSSIPESLAYLQMKTDIQKHITDIRTSTAAKIEALFSGAPAVGPDVLTQLDGLTGGTLKKYLPIESIGSFFSGQGTGGSVMRGLRGMWYNTVLFFGKTELFFGVNLKSILGDVFAGHEEALKMLAVEGALQTAIGKMNGDKKPAPFKLAANWDKDPEALQLLQAKHLQTAASQPFEDFVAGKFVEFARILGQGPVGLRVIEDLAEGKARLMPSPVKPAPAVIATAPPVTPAPATPAPSV